MSQITAFYREESTDARGRTLRGIWAFSDEDMEDVHDFIQWLFPLRERSQYNPNAPLLTDADIAEFQADPKLRANLLRSFERFLAFLGLEYVDESVGPGADFDSKKLVWLEPNHNWLRITRVLASTRLLGLSEASEAFFAFLKGVMASGRSGITAETFAYWSDAAADSP